MGFYAYLPSTELLVRREELDGKKAEVERLTGGCAVTVSDHPSGSALLSVYDEGEFEEWPAGSVGYGVDDEIERVLALCEDGSHVQYLNGDELVFCRADKAGGEVRWRTSDAFPYWDLQDQAS